MLMYAVLLLCVSGTLGRSRIVGGHDTSIMEHQHQVSLQYVYDFCTSAGAGYCHICGASIISENWVVTAAHCVYGARPEQLVIGAEFESGLIRGENYRRIAVDSIYSHPDFNEGLLGAFPNDVALIKLKSSIDLENSNQRAIPLAEPLDIYAFKTCTISGWGLTNGTGGQVPDRLQETTGRISPTCGKWLLTCNFNPLVHICIEDDDSGACNGDSGGPLVCDGKLAGVTSWGASGCDTTYPSVYARVSTYNKWMKDTMASN